MKKYTTPQMLVIRICEKDILTESMQGEEGLPTPGEKELIIEDIW